MTRDALTDSTGPVDDTVSYVEAADGTRLAVHAIGSGPPLLCVPGGPGRASAYLEDLGGLAASYTLLCLDLRGSGLSELPADRDSLAFPRLADDVEAVRVGLGLGVVPVLAHSAGCLVALLLASRYPRSVSRLALVTPTARGIADVSDDIARIRALRSGEPWFTDVMEIVEQLSYLPPERRQRMDRGLRPFGFGRWDERAQAHAASADAQMSLRAAAAFVPADTADLPSPAELGGASVETLVVVGTLDAMTGTRAGDVIAGLLPNAQVTAIEGSGHYPWVDCPDRFRTVVDDFFADRRA